MSEVIKEKCAVAGVSSHDGEQAAPKMYEMLFALQHRGVEATGIASSDGVETHHHVRPGMVRDVYSENSIKDLIGNVAIGHNRYTTNGNEAKYAQPFVDDYIGFSFAHNGNLPDTSKLESFLRDRNFATAQMNDSQMMAAALSHFIRSGNDLPASIEQAYPLFEGSFSCVAMHDGVVAAFRDECGIRPMAIGQTDTGDIVASETCALDIIGADYLREVEPGEMVLFDGENITAKQIARSDPKLDMFELVYFARHDSYLYGQSVNEVRRRFGEQMAKEHPPASDDIENTLVVPVPDTSVPAAEGYADTLGLKHRQAIIKNRFIGRSFMQPSDNERQSQLKRKHNMIEEAVQGKDIVLIDDSIVRLNTLPRLVRLAKQAGARSVQVLIASPPVRFPDYYGIDTPSQSELAAAHMTIEEIRQQARADYLGYLSLSGMVAASGVSHDRFNLSCFNGEYPIDIGKRQQEIRPPVSREGLE